MSKLCQAVGTPTVFRVALPKAPANGCQPDVYLTGGNGRRHRPEVSVVDEYIDITFEGCNHSQRCDSFDLHVSVGKMGAIDIQDVLSYTADASKVTIPSGYGIGVLWRSKTVSLSPIVSTVSSNRSPKVAGSVDILRLGKGLTLSGNGTLSLDIPYLRKALGLPCDMAEPEVTLD